MNALRAESAAIAHVAAGAAYELDPPLSRLLVTLRAALPAVAEDDLVQLEPLRKALAAAEQIEETVRALRGFAPLEDPLHGIDVHEAIELAARFTQQEIAPRATLRRQYARVPRIRGSVPRLARVLMTLLRNAAEAIPSGMPGAHAISIRTSAHRDGGVTIEVADTGRGIEPADVPLVFDPFFTTKARSSSPGLGLTAARAAVLEMGGAITVESVVDVGSAFRVTLPAADAMADPVLPLHESETFARRSILCVAESAADERHLGELVGGDARVTFATCADALLRLSVGEAFDLVFCESRAAARTDFLEHVARVAPGISGRTFALAVRTTDSGVFARPSVARRAASGGGE